MSDLATHPDNPIELVHLSGNEIYLIEVITDWYLREWGINKDVTLRTLSNSTVGSIPAQLVCTVNRIPIGTAGLYSDVGLFREYPAFQKYSPWLALLYVTPEHRRSGIGSDLCVGIEKIARSIGYKELFLYTYTAKNMYTRLGWKIADRLIYKSHETVVMSKTIRE